VKRPSGSHGEYPFSDRSLRKILRVVFEKALAGDVAAAALIFDLAEKRKNGGALARHPAAGTVAR
jgi:hypothetical protein